MSEERSNTEWNSQLRDALALIVSGMRPEDGKLRRRYSALIQLYDRVLGQGNIGNQTLSIGVYGCPKKGKSTLLNSLLGEEILPDKAIPTTSSIITLRRDAAREDYEVNCYAEDGDVRIEHFDDSSEVRTDLDQWGSHQGKDPRWATIDVKGPFPHASESLNPNFILRDTPGAEAYASEEEQGHRLEEDLKRDSERALKSIERTDLHLFCVSCEAIGSESDKHFYDKFFAERPCIHVLTKRDLSHENNDKKIIDDYMNKMKLTTNEEAIMCTVLTGIVPDEKTGERGRFINKGKNSLITAIQQCLDPEFLIKKMSRIAQFIIENHSNENLPAFKEISMIHFRNLDSVLKSK